MYLNRVSDFLSACYLLRHRRIVEILSSVVLFCIELFENHLSGQDWVRCSSPRCWFRCCGIASCCELVISARFVSDGTLLWIGFLFCFSDNRMLLETCAGSRHHLSPTATMRMLVDRYWTSGRMCQCCCSMRNLFRRSTRFLSVMTCRSAFLCRLFSLLGVMGFWISCTLDSSNTPVQ